MPREPRREPEHAEQAALLYWVRLHEARYPELRWLYAVPNGRGRSKSEAGKLKAEGVKRGVPDLALDVARDGYHGLRIEMKAPGKLGTVSPDQRAWHEHLTTEGYMIAIRDDWRDAWCALMFYLGYPAERPGQPALRTAGTTERLMVSA